MPAALVIPRVLADRRKIMRVVVREAVNDLGRVLAAARSAGLLIVR